MYIPIVRSICTVFHVENNRRIDISIEKNWRLIVWFFPIACRNRGWVTVNNPADTSVEVAYKKVGDGHPLRLWRVSTEVEAPPNELLHRVLRERQIWDPQLLKSRLVTKLDTNAEVFQYATGNMMPLPARDYCVLRYLNFKFPFKKKTNKFAWNK